MPKKSVKKGAKKQVKKAAAVKVKAVPAKKKVAPGKAPKVMSGKAKVETKKTGDSKIKVIRKMPVPQGIFERAFLKPLITFYSALFPKTGKPVQSKVTMAANHLTNRHLLEIIKSAKWNSHEARTVLAKVHASAPELDNTLKAFILEKTPEKLIKVLAHNAFSAHASLFTPLINPCYFCGIREECGMMSDIAIFPDGKDQFFAKKLFFDSTTEVDPFLVCGALIRVKTTGGAGSIGSIEDIPRRSHTMLSDIGSNAHFDIDSHINSRSNPHSVSKDQVGLGNVDNVKQLPFSYLDTDVNLGSTNTADDKVPSQKSAKSYIDAHANSLAIHRSINDTGNSLTDLWSAKKIETELTAKALGTDLTNLATIVNGKAGSGDLAALDVRVVALEGRKAIAGMITGSPVQANLRSIDISSLGNAPNAVTALAYGTLLNSADPSITPHSVLTITWRAFIDTDTKLKLDLFVWSATGVAYDPGTAPFSTRQLRISFTVFNFKDKAI